ncbi:hypothetical protein N7523_010721 [Penicillium sp. IBT 18751x]|nr:hypothetical protein N7523_010721 [Penicillium sp. IBT 18751x]
MNFFTTLLLATAASAAPLQNIFNLVTSGASTSHNNDLYVTTESTGPLNSNAVLSTKANAASFYFSNGTVHYEAPNGAPWAMALVSGSDYEDAVEISVDPTTGSEGFKIAKNGNLSVAQPSWGGWLVCTGESDPALYYVNTKATSGALKAGCEKVQLKAVTKTSS